jgi:autotransporter-associated beta strand protein
MRNPFTKTGSSRFSAATALLFSLLLSAFPAFADLIGPYTPDTNTLFLLHFDEAAGGSVTTNLGMKGGNFYSVSEATSSATPPLVTTMLGGAGYVNGPTNFNNCMTNPTVGYLFGYDANKSGAYDGEGSAPAPDALAMTNLNIGFGGQSPFTIEALIQPTTLGANQEIICTDSSSGSRAFQFRITAPGTLTFTYITSGGSISAPIPSTGPDAFVPGTWYHVAIVYNGTVGQLYWTKLDPANGAAHSLGSPTAIVLGTTQGAFTGPLCIGNENRAASGEQFQGSIDEVRISSVARGSGQMQFFSRFVTISANPVSQNVDYNQPVNFSVSASSSFALGYQWRVNSNNIPNATNTAYSIANVAASDAGYYDCVVTNTGGFSATSTEAHLVVGAANFLADRYSFTTDTTDSIGGQTGTNFGDATVNGGKLVLDGTTGTYMQLPGNLFNGANATALTVEFWASFGVNPNNVYAFAFGTTNFVLSAGIVGFNYAQFSPHNAAGQTAATTPGDPGVFTETLNAPGNLDGRTVHVAVVFDPPNKLLSIYTNGVLEAVATNNTVNISSLNDQFSLIGASLYAVDPYLNASIDEIRIFKGALSPLTIKQSQDQGPDTLLADGPAQFVLQPTNTSVPVGQTVTFTTAAVGYLPITYQWLKNGTLVPNETNATYSFATVLGDNTATIKVYATNTIGVTTYVTNSTTATLSVFVPPTVAWLDNADGGANNLWDTTSLNWTNTTGGGPLAFVQNDSTIFDNRGAGSPNVDIQQSVSPNSIQVNATSDYSMGSSSGVGALSGQGSLTKLNSGRLTIDVSNNLSGPVTISGGTVQVGNNDSVGSLGSGVVTNNGTVSIARADAALNFGNAIHGSGSLSFDGLGSVTLSGNSDYTGASAVNAGIVFLTSSNGLGSANSGTAIANAAQVYITANVNVAEGFTINGAGDNNGALRKGGAGLTTESGPITLAADSTIGVDTGATLTVSNTIGGGFALTAIGGGTLALINNSTLSGFTLNGAIVNVGAQGALGSGPVVVSGAGRFVLADGMTFTNAITANSVSPGAVTGLIMVNDNSNGIVTTVTGPLTFNATAASGNDFYGPLTSGLLNITGPITNETTSIVGARDGFVRFSGGGDYLEFDQNQGTTSIGANNGLSTNAILSQGASGASVFDLNGFNQTLVGLADGAANPKVLTNSSSTASTLTLNLNSGVAYGGSLGGNVSLVVTGVGSQQLTGTNRYTGNTTIKAGLLQVSNPSFSAGSTVTIANGALLQMDFTTTNIINKLVLNGVSQPPGLYNNSSSSSFILGTGTLLVSLVNPTPTNIVTTVNGNQLTLSWPSDHIGWRLQAQTNPPGVGLNSTWVDVGGSTNVNTVPITIIGTNGSVFFRMIYP